MSEDLTPETTTEQPLADRGNNRSQRPSSPEFVRFITSGWGERPSSTLERSPAADLHRRAPRALSARFPGVRLVIPAGSLKTRSNDTDYRFRPHSAFAHLTGLGTDQEPDAVLVLHPVADGAGDDGIDHHAVLYVRPLAAGTTRSSSPTPATASSGSAPARRSTTSRPSPASRPATSTSWATPWPRTSARTACASAW